MPLSPFTSGYKPKKGKWVQERCDDLSWHTNTNSDTYGYSVILRGSITDQHATEYYLTFTNESCKHTVFWR